MILFNATLLGFRGIFQVSNPPFPPFLKGGCKQLYAPLSNGIIFDNFSDMLYTTLKVKYELFADRAGVQPPPEPRELPRTFSVIVINYAV